MATRKAPAKRAAKAPAKSAGKPGKPTLWRDEYTEQARKLCERGFTDLEVADFFRVGKRTLYDWKAAKPEFAEAFRLGKEEPDERVTRSLYAAATGYEHDEIDIRVVGNRIVKTPIRKFYPPNPTAMVFWLKNRRQWRSDPEIPPDDKPTPQRVPVEIVDASAPDA